MTAETQEWTGEAATIAEIERELGDLRRAASGERGSPTLRTSVMTHLAWVPEEWLGAALETLAGLAERHPSRTIILVPDPDAPRSALDAEVSLRCFPLDEREREVCSEVIQLRLRGGRAKAPASVVMPLLISDLPVFCRWRGQPPFGAPEFEQLVDLDHEPADEIERIAINGEELQTPPRKRRDASDLLSEELDRFTRDRVFEAAARAALSAS